jgi:Tol biopolymer transport system component
MTWGMLLVLACLCALAIGTATTAQAQERNTYLLSRSFDGGLPNGESRNPTISRDQRISRYIAYESDATNIVHGDTNGMTDIFLVKRSAPWRWNGTPWHIGPVKIASQGTNGEPANGRSYKPSLSGTGSTNPTCLGFISEASNLVPGDTNGVADAFVYNLKSGKLKRVSVNSRGAQANGPTTEISVDGKCRRVAFVSTATNLAYTGGGPKSWKTAQTTENTNGYRQVFVHVLKDPYKRLTFLASASKSRKAANSDAYQLSFARFGHFVAFTSTATNLSPRDGDGGEDVYRRAFERGKWGKSFTFSTTLVSERNGTRGNGPSSHPSINEYGQYVAYQSDASNLLAGDTNGVTDIVRADLATHRNIWVSLSVDGPANAASVGPEISGGGLFVFFASKATNLRPGKKIRPVANGQQNVMLWNKNNRHVSIEARDHERRYLDGPASNPTSSLRGNYVLFESSATAADKLIRNFTQRDQVYMLYLGPK